MSGAPARAVFLDRDGVLNEAVVRDGRPYAPDSLEALKIYPDAAEALWRLKQLGFLLLVVTNQPEVARGRQSRATIDAMHEALRGQLPLDDFLVCCHDDRDACECRKPKPGLLLEAAIRYQINLPASFVIGDRWRDIEAGAAAGCRTVLIDRHYRERAPSAEPGFRTDSLTGAVNWIAQSD